MNLGNYKVWIEAEQWKDGYDVNNDNTDVVVTFSNERNVKWIASFFTYNNLQKQIEKNKNTGENLHGNYFWSSDMIFVDEISRKRIEEVINCLIQKEEFNLIFTSYPDLI